MEKSAAAPKRQVAPLCSYRNDAPFAKFALVGCLCASETAGGGGTRPRGCLVKRAAASESPG
eukprot:6200953-Pleurochrysis_carterae.AAC.1